MTMGYHFTPINGYYQRDNRLVTVKYAQKKKRKLHTADGNVHEPTHCEKEYEGFPTN